MIPLVLGYWKKDKSIQFTGLLLLGLSLIGLPIAMGSGEETFEKFMDGSITASLDEDGAHYALLHYAAAESISKIGYLTLALVIGQLFFWKKIFRHKQTLFLITCILNLFLILGFAYVGYIGGKIRHPEFRPLMSGEAI